MTPQQKRFSGRRQGTLDLYRELVVGDGGWGALTVFEIYTLLIAGLPGALGLALRRLALPRLLRHCGSGTTVGRGVTIRQPSRIALGKGVIIDDLCVLDNRSFAEAPSDFGITIGDHVVIGRQTILNAKGGRIILRDGCNVSSSCRIATQSLVDIGESVLIAAFVYIGPGNHTVGRADQPIIEQEMELRGGVRIGRGAWIGTRATILDGVTIGEGAVVGAHSLVNEDVPPHAIVAGTPARVLRYRD